MKLQIKPSTFLGFGVEGLSKDFLLAYDTMYFFLSKYSNGLPLEKIFCDTKDTEGYTMAKDALVNIRKALLGYSLSEASIRNSEKFSNKSWVKVVFAFNDTEFEVFKTTDLYKISVCYSGTPREGRYYRASVIFYKNTEVDIAPHFSQNLKKFICPNAKPKTFSARKKILRGVMQDHKRLIKLTKLIGTNKLGQILSSSNFLGVRNAQYTLHDNIISIKLSMNELSNGTILGSRLFSSFECEFDSLGKMPWTDKGSLYLLVNLNKPLFPKNPLGIYSSILTEEGTNMEITLSNGIDDIPVIFPVTQEASKQEEHKEKDLNLSVLHKPNPRDQVRFLGNLISTGIHYQTNIAPISTNKDANSILAEYRNKRHNISYDIARLKSNIEDKKKERDELLAKLGHITKDILNLNKEVCNMEGKKDSLKAEFTATMGEML